MVNKILVTGATGTVGREVIRQLVAEGTIVRAGVHTLAKAEPLREQGIEVVHLDYEELIGLT